MVRIASLLTALIVAFAMTAFAAEKAADVTPSGAAPAPEMKKDEQKPEMKKKAHHWNHFYGEVKAVDAKAGTVTISRGEKTFTADEKLLTGINVGDKVSVRFKSKDGQLTATSIKHAKEHHKKPEMKKEEEKKTEDTK